MSPELLNAQGFLDADANRELASEFEKQLETPRLRRELQKSVAPDMKIRRAIIGLSLVGIGAMAAVSLFQTGIVKHLPDPPLPNFDSDKVNSSETAYALGAPDGTIALAGFAANLPIAAFGGENRHETMPLVPITAAVKASIEAAVSGWYFYQMPAVEKKWCAYCIVGAAANFGIAALTLIEAKRAWKNLGQ